MNSRGHHYGNEADSAAQRAGRPAGMPLGQWLNAKVAHPAAATMPQPSVSPQPSMPSATSESVSEIHRRLDGITRQIDQMSQRRTPATTGASGLANQLNDAISRLDLRLSNLTESAPQTRQAYRNDAVERAATQVYQTPAYQHSPPLSPTMDSVVAEIAARQNMLNRGGAYAPAPNPFMQYAPAPALAPAPLPPAPAPVDLSGIERQLNTLTSRMEALRYPDHLDQSITAFREELAEIRRSLTEALPRQALDSLENEIRTLAQKIEQSRDSGGDTETLGGIERALNDIYSVVRTLTPAEQLAGYDTAIQNLSGKIDLLVRANPDSNIVQQLEDAIAALRNIAATVATNDAIERVSEHLHALGEKVDRLAQTGGHDMLAALEQRIALLTAAMEGRPMPVIADSRDLETAIHTLSERIDRISAGGDSSAAIAHVEQRIAYLLERIEGSQPAQTGNFGRIEESLSDILRQLEHQRQNFASTGGMQTNAVGNEFVDTIRRELSQTDRRTQDALEAVHNTLSHVVDRLATIETDLRRMPPAPVAPAAAMPPVYASPLPSFAPIQPELPNPVLSQSYSDYRTRAAVGDEQLSVPSSSFLHQPLQRAPIDPNLPPDFPLEPGARQQPETEVNFNDAATTREGSSQSNFIAAARRAAQAATVAANEKPSRVTVLTEAARNAAARATAKVAAAGDKSAKPSRVRSILVGLSVFVIVLGTFKMAMSLLDGSDTTPTTAPIEKSNAPATTTLSSLPSAPDTKALASQSPLLTSPGAMQRQSFVAPSTPAQTSPTANETKTMTADVTGSVTFPASSVGAQPDRAAPSTGPVTAALSPVGDAIPEALAGPALRAAAMRGEPAAAYEIAVRYADGKGVQSNYDEAAKWYERAAQKGVVMAMFRLGTLREKGLGGKKDADEARNYYSRAAERGNAKAMHNLAVLDADGGGKGPNYKSASSWFKKAAERGVADSQYNLGILYARGIGVEQNLAESFKWFSLAATQGDADAGRKRDDVAKRLDQQSLAAAKLAIQTFTPERQPEDATTVAAPAGGWDAAAAAPAAKRPSKPAPKQTNAAR